MPRSLRPFRHLPSSSSPMRGAGAAVGLVVAAVVTLGGAGCASCESAGMHSVALMGGTINDPANKSLRRGMLAFGIDRACSEMLKQPTALREGGESGGAATNPTNGRFQPTTCSQTTAANGDLVVSFTGRGYTYASGVHKVTFDASATVEFDQDFLMNGSELYGYFRTKQVSKPQVQVKVVESTLPAIFDRMTGFGDTYASQMLDERVRDGFTIRRKASSETDFRAGIVQVGTWPVLGYQTTTGLTLWNDRSEVHEGERDFVGPIVVDDASQAALVTLKIDGAETLNVVVVDDRRGARGSISTSRSRTRRRRRHGRSRKSSRIRVPRRRCRFLGRGRTGWCSTIRRRFREGASPPGHLLDDRAAVATYAVVLGKKP